jgi:hypothetical protein
MFWIWYNVFCAKQNFDWIEKLHTLCTDGTSVMLDDASSFSSLVKKEAPHVIVYHLFYTNLHWKERFFQQP